MTRYTITYTDALGGSHTVQAESVSVELNRADAYTDERGRFSRTALLRELGAGQSATVPFKTERDYSDWRSTGCYVGRIFGSAFKFRHRDNIITIKRVV